MFCTGGVCAVLRRCRAPRARGCSFEDVIFFFHYSADKQGWKHHVSTPSGPAALSLGANEEREHVQVTEGGRGIFLAEVVAPVN